MGGSYFSTDSAEAIAAAPRIIGCESQIMELGALFAEARVRFAFDNGGYY